MFDPGLSRPDVCSIRAAAEQAEFAEACGVPGVGGCPPTDNDLPLPGRDRRIPYHRLGQLVNAALASIPYRSGYPIRQLGTAGAWLVAGNSGQGAGAG
ncbi:MAG TPA: hypothetical protein VIY52_09640 [Streptosporangiaceae bacterium]